MVAREAHSAITELDRKDAGSIKCVFWMRWLWL